MKHCLTFLCALGVAAGCGVAEGTSDPSGTDVENAGAGGGATQPRDGGRGSDAKQDASATPDSGQTVVQPSRNPCEALITCGVHIGTPLFRLGTRERALCDEATTRPGCAALGTGAFDCFVKAMTCGPDGEFETQKMMDACPDLQKTFVCMADTADGGANE